MILLCTVILSLITLTVKPIKCQLFHRRVTYLGHLFGGGEVRPLLPKIQVLKKFLRPKTKRQLRFFLDLSKYYRKYMNIMQTRHTLYMMPLKGMNLTVLFGMKVVKGHS